MATRGVFISDIKIQHVGIDTLKPADYNPRTTSPEEHQQLKTSITRFGFVDPIICNSSPSRRGVIIGGHFRWRVAKDLGCKTVPAIFLSIPDLAKEKELNLRLNKNQGQWDVDLLAHFDPNLLSQVGFSGQELDSIFGAKSGRHDPNIAPSAPTKAKSKPGEIYCLGKHRVLCGDATNSEQIKRLMNGAEANMIFTDPPYNVDYSGKGTARLKILNDNMSSSKFAEFLDTTFKALRTVSAPGASIYVCHADLETVNFRTAMANAGWLVKQTVIWAKQSFVLGRQDYQWQHEPILYGWSDSGSHKFYGGRKQSTIWFIDRPIKSEEHPTMKPVELCEKAILNSSKRGAAVLDPFGGSGSTLLACERVDRACYTMELDPRFVDVIVKRWENYTGKKATRYEK